jgi:hypothetical protein
MKSNTILNSVAIIFAGVVGMLTGAAVEHLPLARALVISSMVGLAAGAVLYVVLKLVMKGKPQ